MRERLIFVYKADSGLFNTLADMAHKWLSPETYECRLCALTHGVFSMHRPWRAFLDGLEHEMEFLHRDEFRRRYPGEQLELPAILRQGKGGLEVLISARELLAMGTLEQLQATLREKIS